MAKTKFIKEKYEECHRLRRKLNQFCLPHGHLVRLFRVPHGDYVDIRCTSFGRPTRYGVRLLIPEYLEMVQRLENDVDRLMEDEIPEDEENNGLVAAVDAEKENIEPK